MNQVPPLPPFRRRHKGYGGQVGHPLLRPNAEERDGERSVLLRFMGSPLFLTDLLTDHEPVRFMGSGPFRAHRLPIKHKSSAPNPPISPWKHRGFHKRLSLRKRDE